MSPWIWATGAAVVAILELHAPGYYLIWLAIGAALTAAFSSIVNLSLEGQLTTFALAASLSCFLGFFAYRRLGVFVNGFSIMNNRSESMVGSKGIVCVAIVNGRGKVRLGDSVWIAEGPDMDIDTPIVVRGLRSTIVVVDAVT